jgi:xylulokinase
MAGMIDTSAALMLFGPSVGQLINVSGSTDVLSLCTDNPKPHEKLLTRTLGIGKFWLSVGTLAAAGSAIVWAREQFFRDLSTNDYYKLVTKLARKPEPSPGTTPVIFEPYLAGERTSIDQKYASFSNLKLATTREDLLESIIDAIAKASGARLTLLKSQGTKIKRKVFTSGGAARSLHEVLYRDWPGQWQFKSEQEASLRGLSRLVPVPI